MQAVYLGFTQMGAGVAQSSVGLQNFKNQGMNLVTRAYTPGKNGLHRLLPQDTMPARVQAPSFWQTRGPPESAGDRTVSKPRKKVQGPAVPIPGLVQGMRTRASGGPEVVHRHSDLLRWQLCPLLLGEPGARG